MGVNEQDLSTLDHYSTPARVWQPIVDIMGPIGLDPFSNPVSLLPATVKWTDWGPAQNLPRGMFQKDGFVEPWGGYGLVFCNGPFSNVAGFLCKCATDGDETIFLCRSNMNARYLHRYAIGADRILFFDKRLTFQGQVTQAPFHCLLGYWGVRTALFEQVAEAIGGWCVKGKGVQACDDALARLKETANG